MSRPGLISWNITSRRRIFLAGTRPKPKCKQQRSPSVMRRRGKKLGNGVGRKIPQYWEKRRPCLGGDTRNQIRKAGRGVSRTMQPPPEKKLHRLRTNPLGKTLPRQQTFNPTDGSNWTKPECFPDFFLIGAPRCGTTSLSRYLADNPQVCFSRPKEPHYFSLLAPHASLDDLETAYLSRYFSHCRGEHKAIGEGSVSYLYAPYALQQILSINPQAKFIAILRNPLDMLPSYHLRLRFT